MHVVVIVRVLEDKGLGGGGGYQSSLLDSIDGSNRVTSPPLALGWLLLLPSLISTLRIHSEDSGNLPPRPPRALLSGDKNGLIKSTCPIQRAPDPPHSRPVSHWGTTVISEWYISKPPGSQPGPISV